MSTRVALVTGSSRGLGRAIALRLASDGCDVGVTFENSADLAEEVVASIQAMGRRAFSVQLDVSDMDACGVVVRRVAGELGSLDVLVCNAGIFSRSLIVETSDEEFSHTFAVNVGGVFAAIRAALPIMMKQQSGRIITISSHNAKRGTGSSSRATYAATKNAVESYTKGAAVEAAPFNITVNAVSPGWIEKEPPPAQRSELQLKLLENIPLHRPGTPEEIAAAVSFLASAEAGYITGETFDVNGGTWMD